jgi:dCMP deaminase
MSRSSERLSWDELFYGIALLSSKRSEDPHTKVGACLVKDKHVIGIGYNGAPRGFSGSFDWMTPEKYDYVIHAEMNAIANACAIGAQCSGADIYLTLSPCHDCMKLIVQHQIKRVFFKDRYKDFDLTLKIASACGVKLKELVLDDEGKIKDIRAMN